MRRARDSVADRSSRLPTRDGGRAAGLRLVRLAVRRTIGSSVPQSGLCEYSHADVKWGRRRPGVLRPERRASLSRPSPSPRSPQRRVPIGLGNAPLISHGPGCDNAPEVESHLAQSSGTRRGGRRAAGLRHCSQTRGERHLSAADQRAATVLRRGSPLVRWRRATRAPRLRMRPRSRASWRGRPACLRARRPRASSCRPAS
jgi:hypothetical protein